MRIQYFEVENFCGFESFRCEFTPGLNLLVGPNGAGKSSILEGLNILFYAAAASRSQYIRAGTNSAVLRSEFILDDVPYLCKRSISMASSSAEIINLETGKPICYGVNAVKSFFDSAFNLEGRGFSWYLRQGTIPSFLSIFANYDLDKIFSLFGIGTLKNFSTYFNATLKSLFGDAQADYSHADYLCSNLQSKIVEHEEALTQLKAQSSGYSRIKQEYQEAEKELRRLEEQKKLADVYRYYTNLLKSAEEVDKAISALEDSIKRLKEKAGAELLPTASAVGEEQFTALLYALNQQLSLLANQKKEYARYLELSAKISQCLARFRKRPTPSTRALTQTQIAYQDASSRLEVYLKNDPRIQLERYTKQGLIGKCPLCEQEIPIERLKEFASECHNLEAQAKQLYKSLERFQLLRKERAELRSLIRQLRDSYRRVRSATQYSDVKEQELSQLRDYVTKVLEELRKLQSELISLNGKKASITSSLNQIKDIPCVTYPGDDAYTLARLRCSELSQKLEQLEKAVVQVQAAETHLEWLRNSLREAEMSRERYKKKSDIVNICTRICKDFVEDVQQYICNLLSEGGFLSIVNKILAEIDAIYRVSFEFNGETYDFIAHFPNGTKISVVRLSYGQQVILAFILLFVFYLMTCSTGVLLVDEPTAGLDARHLNGISTILDTMNTLCHNQNVQCIMATHESDILRGNYNVIHIGKEAHT